MIHYLRFKNFFSFADETVIDFRLGGHAPEDGLSFTSPAGERLSKVLMVVGANGSGKTRLLQALSFLASFISESFSQDEMIESHVSPHFFSGSGVSEFKLQFEINQKIFRYFLTLENGSILHESLYHKTSRVFSYLFQRDRLEAGGGFLVKQKGYGFSKSQAEKTRSTVSLVAAADQFEVEIAKSIRDFFYSDFIGNIHYMGRMDFSRDNLFQYAKGYFKWPLGLKRVSSILGELDLGLTEVRIEKQEINHPNGDMEEVYIPYGLHRDGENAVLLQLVEESGGTRNAFMLMALVLPILESGGIIVIDELESNLHPHMLGPILDLFFSEETNPKNAQIIFSSHSLEILNRLEKSKVLLVEKADGSRSQAWRLDQMRGVRADDNLYAKYMAGAYGAVPNLS